MLILLFSFYINNLDNIFLEKIPLNLFNPLATPLFYEDSVNDFSPNIHYRNILRNIFEPDSEKTISRFLLYRSTLSTEENAFLTFLPLFKNEINLLFYFSLFKNKTYFDFSKHNYFFKIKSKKIPLSFSFLQFDANPYPKKILIKDLSVSFKFLPFKFLYSKESGKYIKEKFFISFQNLFKNLFYNLSYIHYNFLLSEKRILKNFEIDFKFSYLFSEIEIGKESNYGERYIINAGIDFKSIKFSYFIEKLLFPFLFDSLRSFFEYKEPVRKKGISGNIDFKNNFLGLNFNLKYFKTKSLMIIDPFQKLPFLYSGNIFYIFSSDSILFYKKLMFFVKYGLIKGKNLEFNNFEGGFKFFILRNDLKNYFVYLRGTFYSFQENYLWRVSLTGDFYSYLMINFSYSQPAGGNYFYPENYLPFPYYSIKIAANIPD